MMSDSDWRQLDDERWAEFRTALLREKGSEEQEEFLQGIRDGKEFIKKMDQIPVVGTLAVDLYKVKLSEAQFKNPPDSTESRMYDLWTNLSLSIASSTSFWAHVTMCHVREGRIEPSFLASNGIASQTGAERIDKIITDKTPNWERRMDDCVRSALRQLGGLPHVRGNKSVLVDCPFARAWWRERLVRRAEERSGIAKDLVGKLLRQTKGHWEWFVSAMVSKNPVFGMELMQEVVAASLTKFLSGSPGGDDKLPPASKVRDICQAICIIGGSRELAVLEYNELRCLIDATVDEIKNTEPND